MKIVLNIIATGKYIDFLDALVESANRNFFPDDDIFFILHTDHTDIKYPENFIINRIDFEPWPNPTLKRFHYFLMKEKEISGCDFSFYVDVDSLFVNLIDIDLEKIEGIIPTLHPGYYGKVGTPERNPNSTAYLPPEARNNYICGGFFGGNSKSFLSMCNTIRENIDTDLRNGIIARWHDESHLNHYLFHNPPKNILGNHFAISEPERGEFPKSPLVFLDKNHDEIRKEK